MSDSKPCRDRSASWSDGRIDFTLPSFESITTSRPVDLTKAYRKDRDCPRQYDWAGDSMALINQSLMMSTRFVTRAFGTIVFCVSCGFPPSATKDSLRLCTCDGGINVFSFECSTHLERPEPFSRHAAVLRGERESGLKRLHPVFVEAHNGLHFGRWVNDLCSRPARASGLFIQVHGDE